MAMNIPKDKSDNTGSPINLQTGSSGQRQNSIADTPAVPQDPKTQTLLALSNAANDMENKPKSSILVVI
jgi:hypothetical protein